MRHIILILISGMILLASCKETKTAEKQELTQMERVIAIHDEVMPEMGTISDLVSQLKAKADSTEKGMLYAGAMKDLQDAHGSMMDWMKGFGTRFDHDEVMKGKELTEEKQIWLDEEEVKVKALRKRINQSIASAQALLDSLQ